MYVTWVIALMELECAPVETIPSALSRLIEGEYFTVGILFDALKRFRHRHCRNSPNQNTMQVEVRVDEPLSRFLCAVFACDHVKGSELFF